MQNELAHSVVTMRLTQTEKLLEWMVANASADVDTLASALGSVRDALACVGRPQPVTS